MHLEGKQDADVGLVFPAPPWIDALLGAVNDLIINGD